MNETQPLARNAQARIGKQMMLPWSKAFEIALKSIKVRFWRSMITMSSIVLAIAFLMSIWTSTAITMSLSLGPQREIDAIKARLAVVREAIKGGAGAPTRAEVEERYAADLADARALKQAAIREKQSALDSATTDEAKKLKDEIEALQAELGEAKTLELLRDHLAACRSAVETTKGRLDTILQQERAGGETQAKEDAPPPPKDSPAPSTAPPAPRAGGIGAFLDFMSPTDKWLAVLALLVCFVGIVNAMFMTVQERFREIGTMKCLGALDAFIVKIFLIESAMLGFIGTLAGIVIGFLLSTVRQWIVYGGATWTYLSLASILFAALMAALVGLVLSIVAAIFPAQKAARMQPVAAMRIEE
ncbi:MAG TPA: FtsX-like permease family protein [Planctomycetota bacterium]|nr:FtsX-like permease family protein [Planctomycetota bacterium]